MARVLIADDASFMRQMIREIIEPEGHEVVGEATNGIEAVDLYNELSPDLVTMDIVMPKRSGIDAVKTILRTQAEPPLDQDQAFAVAQQYAARRQPPCKLIRIEEQPLMWVFRHSAEDYAFPPANATAALRGGGPIVVVKAWGTAHECLGEHDAATALWNFEGQLA